MKTLENISLITNRIAKVNATAPFAPVTGRGFVREELNLPLVFALLQKRAPAHCGIATNREETNRFGKLGFVPHHYISPELAEVVNANKADFVRLEASLELVAKFAF